MSCVILTKFQSNILAKSVSLGATLNTIDKGLGKKKKPLRKILSSFPLKRLSLSMFYHQLDKGDMISYNKWCT